MKTLIRKELVRKKIKNLNFSFVESLNIARLSNYYKERLPQNLLEQFIIWKKLDISDYYNRHLKMKELFPSINLIYFKLKYGDKLGQEKYTERANKNKYFSSKAGMIEKHGKEKASEILKSIGGSLEKSIKKLGKEEGTKHWNKICKQNSDTAKTSYFVDKYGQEKASEIQKSKGKAQTIEYFIEKGYTDEEAKQKLKERQSTFSLEICIEKHGKDKGLKIFNDRQKRWQETLNNKTQEEIDRINQLKGTGSILGRMENLGIEESKKLFNKLYYIRFFNEEIEFWKIGITKNQINKRFGSKLLLEKNTKLKREVLFEIDSNLFDSFSNEQNILREHKEYRIRVNYNGFSSTECFSKDIFKDFNYKYKIKEDLSIISYNKT